MFFQLYVKKTILKPFIRFHSIINNKNFNDHYTPLSFYIDNAKYKYCKMHQQLAFLSGNSNQEQYSVQLQQALNIEKQDIEFLEQSDHCTVCKCS